MQGVAAPGEAGGMTTFHPVFQFLLLTLTGWLSRRQQDVIDYLREENRVLRDQLGGRRLRLTDYQRRRLAVKGKVSFPRTPYAHDSLHLATARSTGKQVILLPSSPVL